MKYRRQFDLAKPPFDRLKELHVLPPAVIPELEALRTRTNPLFLREEIGQLIDQLLVLPVLDQSETVNVFNTLLKEADSSVTLSVEPMITVQ